MCEQFRKHNMRLKLAKCEFLKDKIQFLGHMINHKGIQTLPKKTKEISKIKAAANINETRALLGLLNYNCRFIPAFADLMQLVQKHEVWMDSELWRSIAKKKTSPRPNAVPPRSKQTLDHRNRCKQSSLCRPIVVTTRKGWHSARGPSDINFLQFYGNATIMEHYQMWTLCNFHIS